MKPFKDLHLIGSKKQCSLVLSVTLKRVPLYYCPSWSDECYVSVTASSHSDTAHSLTGIFGQNSQQWVIPSTGANN